MNCNMCGKRPATALVWSAVYANDQMGYMGPELLCNICLTIKFGMGKYAPNEYPLAMDLSTIKKIGAPCYKSIFLREELIHNEFKSSHWQRILESLCGAAIPIRPPKGGNSGS